MAAGETSGRTPLARQNAPGTLYVVATPIGNLEDITLRALRILREVALVAAEDTRRTGNLLRHYGISTPLLSVHEHNERQRSEHVLGRLAAGESIALVTDAGTPGISDPGALLVRAARDAGLRVEPVPGPSAMAAALSVAGLAEDRFVFVGFPPSRSTDRNKWLASLGGFGQTTIVAFEAPHRIRQTLVELRSMFVDRPILLGRELTKAHEQWVTIPPGSTDFDAIPERGEFVLLLPPAENEEMSAGPTWSDEEIASEFGRTPEKTGVSRRDAARQLAERLGISTRAVYDALERAKNAGKA